MLSAMEARTLRAALLLIALGVPAGAAERLPEGFVYLREVAPGIVQDMRYAGFDNFTGRPLPGYDARRMRAAARGGAGARPVCRPTWRAKILG